MLTESHGRSLAKAITWRILGTIATTLIVFLFTRRLAASLAVGGFEFLSKIGLFWFHERIWERISLGKREDPPAVLWFTGLSGSGKSTIAHAVRHELEKGGRKVEHLDGDTIRDVFPKTGFTSEERDAHIRRVGYLAAMLEKNGVSVVASLVSPYKDSRRFVRDLCTNFVEIHVATPLSECEKRDTKGLYAKARRGEIANFTGISDPYETPSSPEVTIDTQSVSVREATKMILARLSKTNGKRHG